MSQGTTDGHYSYYGCPLPKMPDETVVVGMCLQLKVMDGDGNISNHEFATGVGQMEQLGMVESASDTIRLQIMKSGRQR